MSEYSQTRIQVRRGTAAQFAAANPVLGVGEPAFETDTNTFKLGDGTTAYSSLSAITGGGGGSGISNVVEDTTPQLGGPITPVGSATRSMIIDGSSTQVESASILLRGSGVDSTTTDGFLVMQYGSNNHAYLWNYETDGQIIFGVNNMQSMKLMPDGKLGINQTGTTPSYYLTVNGDAWVKENIQAAGFVKTSGTSSQFLKADGTIDSNSYLTSASALSDVVDDTTPQLGGNLDTNNKDIVFTSGSTQYANIGLTTSDLHINVDDANAESAADRIQFNIDGTQVLSMTSPGGYDTTYLQQKVDINTNGQNRTIFGYSSNWFNVNKNNIDFRVDGDSIDYAFFVDASEDSVGIGTNTPQTKLDVSGVVTASSFTTTGASIIPFYYANQAAFPNATTYHGAIAHSHSDGAMYFAHGGVWNMLANTEGGAVFNEDGASVDFRVEGDTDTDLFFVDGSADKVGISTNTPDYLFQVKQDATDLAGFTKWYTTGPVGSGNIQNLVVQAFGGAGAKGIYLSHYCNESGGSETQTLKNVIRMGEGIISLDDAYSTGLSTTYYPKLQVNTETGAVTFNNTYTFPTADGSADQVLKTDGAGNISFATVSTTNLDTTNFSAATIVTEAEGIGSNDNDTTLPTSAAVKDYADTKLKSDVTGITGAVAVANIVLISQSNYDALSSYDTNTLYHII